VREQTDLLAIGASLQHGATLPVVQIQSLICEVIVLFVAEDARPGNIYTLLYIILMSHNTITYIILMSHNTILYIILMSHNTVI